MRKNLQNRNRNSGRNSINQSIKDLLTLWELRRKIEKSLIRPPLAPGVRWGKTGCVGKKYPCKDLSMSSPVSQIGNKLPNPTSGKMRRKTKWFMCARLSRFGRYVEKEQDVTRIDRWKIPQTRWENEENRKMLLQVPTDALSFDGRNLLALRKKNQII